MFSDRFVSYEEAYHFRSDPRSVNATVILSYDPSSVDDPQYGTRPYFQGTPPPIAWYREGQTVDLSNGTAASPPKMTGRTWMTSLGHTIEVWSDPTHLAHVEAGCATLCSLTLICMLTPVTPQAPLGTPGFHILELLDLGALLFRFCSPSHDSSHLTFWLGSGCHVLATCLCGVHPFSQARLRPSPPRPVHVARLI